MPEAQFICAGTRPCHWLGAATMQQSSEPGAVSLVPPHPCLRQEPDESKEKSSLPERKSRTINSLEAFSPPTATQ